MAPDLDAEQSRGVRTSAAFVEDSYYDDRHLSQPPEGQPATIAPRYTRSAGPASPNSYGSRTSVSPGPFRAYTTAEARLDGPQAYYEPPGGAQHSHGDWFADGEQEHSEPSRTTIDPQEVH
jgi:hypothetical protein